MAKKKNDYFGDQPIEEPVDEAPAEEQPAEEAEAKAKDEDGGVQVTNTKHPELDGEYPTTEEVLERYKGTLDDSGVSETIVLVDSAGAERDWPGEDAIKMMKATLDYVYNKHRNESHDVQDIEYRPADRNLVI